MVDGEEHVRRDHQGHKGYDMDNTMSKAMALNPSQPIERVAPLLSAIVRTIVATKERLESKSTGFSRTSATLIALSRNVKPAKSGSSRKRASS